MHTLAAWRRIGTISDVERGRWPGADEDQDRMRFSYFHQGAISVACLADLSWLVVTAAAEPNHGGGNIVVWGASAGVASAMLLDGDDCCDQAIDVQVGPDGSVAVTAAVVVSH